MMEIEELRVRKTFIASNVYRSKRQINMYLENQKCSDSRTQIERLEIAKESLEQAIEMERKLNTDD